MTYRPGGALGTWNVAVKEHSVPGSVVSRRSWFELCRGKLTRLVLHQTSIFVSGDQNQFSSRPLGPDSVTLSPGLPSAGASVPNVEIGPSSSAGGQRSTTRLERVDSIWSLTERPARSPKAS